MRGLRAELSEIFTSIQGEGILLGVKQLFVRFSKCNLNCYYCDTPKDSKFCRDHVRGKTLRNPIDLEYVEDVAKSVKVHSISWTGGEPLLYADFIRNFEKIHPFYLESNMTLPDEAKKVRNLVDYVAGDFKVRFVLKNVDYEEVFENTVRCFKILRNTRNPIRRVVCESDNISASRLFTPLPIQPGRAGRLFRSPQTTRQGWRYLWQPEPCAGTGAFAWMSPPQDKCRFPRLWRFFRPQRPPAC